VSLFVLLLELSGDCIAVLIGFKGLSGSGTNYFLTDVVLSATMASLLYNSSFESSLTVLNKLLDV